MQALLKSYTNPVLRTKPLVCPGKNTVKILTALDHADRLMRTTFKPSFSCLTSFLVKKKMTRFFYKEGIRDTKKEVKKLKILLFFF